MSPADAGFLALACGIGMLWQGAWILIAGRLPRRLRGQPRPAARDPAQAFMLFWLEQYSWIGVLLAAAGSLMIVIGGAAWT